MFEGLFRGEHLLIILVIALLLFGPSKLPTLGAGLGKAIRDFKKAVSEPDRDPGQPMEAKNLPRGEER